MKQFKMNERQRFSIRKFSIGAASVLLGSVFFVANPATEVQAAEANTEVVSQDGNGNTGNPSVLPPSDTSNQNLNVEQEGAKPNTQETEKKEPGTPSKDSEGKAKSTVENTGDEKVDGVVKPVSGESSPVFEEEKDKKEVQPELEEKSSIIKEEANREDKIDQSQEEDGYQLYDKLIDASKRLKESNPESAADFKNLADTINEKLGLSDDGKISGELVEKAHKLLDGNQIDKDEIEGANNFRRRKREAAKTESTTIQMGLVNSKGNITNTKIISYPEGLGFTGTGIQVKAISGDGPITAITVSKDHDQGFPFTVKENKSSNEATVSFEGNTPRSGGWVVTVRVETKNTYKEFQFGYYAIFKKPNIITTNEELKGKAEVTGNYRPDIKVSIPAVPKLPQGAKMKVYLVGQGGQDYGDGYEPDPAYSNIIASKDVSPNNDGNGSSREVTITKDDYKATKLGTGGFKALTVIELADSSGVYHEDYRPRTKGSFYSNVRTATKAVAPADKVEYIKRDNNIVKQTTHYTVNSTDGTVTENPTKDEEVVSPESLGNPGITSVADKTEYYKQGDDVMKRVTTYDVNRQTGKVTANSTETVHTANGAKDKVEYIKRDNNIVKQTTHYTVNSTDGTVTENPTKDEEVVSPE
ncbi:YSIRK-type signal peptide-containing protein, partial [Streptococcus sp. SPS1]|uniref:YSIRK-type signal peptide-containing protein n=1 Tax=Streptococcus sp. SPS1 TaxID=3018247 RepID=UPI00263E0806